MSSLIYFILPEETCKQSEKKNLRGCCKYRLKFVLYHCQSDITDSFTAKCLKYHTRRVEEDTRRSCSECFPALFAQMLSFALISVPIPIHLECTLKFWGFKWCYFDLAPSKMNIWLKDKMQDVRNQSVNCTISSPPALSSSHHVLISGIYRKKESRKKWSVSCTP